MSLLHQDTQEDIDDAARGEEFTKGTSHVIVASLVAGVLVTIAVAAYVLAGEKPPAAAGQILEVWAHPRHVETSGFDANGAPIPKEHFDQVLLFAHVKVHNQSKTPLFMLDVLANAAMADGLHSISAGSAGQYDQVFVAYPEMAPLRQTALSPRATIAPGETVEGTVFWGLQMTKQQWDARKSLDFTFSFQYQPSLKLAPTMAVTER
ncbi:MAG: hypothetical protein WCE75_13325 [Terracidiphilus sp.]